MAVIVIILVSFVLAISQQADSQPRTDEELLPALVACSGSTEETERKVAEFFATEGYRLESGTQAHGTYRSSGKLFQHTYRFDVTVCKGLAGSNVEIANASSSGIFGRSRVRRELDRVRGGIKAALL